jgi:hypothetical protein
MQNGPGAQRSGAGHKRVAVRFGFGDVGEADNAAGPGFSLEHHRLTNNLRDTVEDNARRCVGGASCREWTDDPDRPGGPIIGLSGPRGEEEKPAESSSEWAKR